MRAAVQLSDIETPLAGGCIRSQFGGKLIHTGHGTAPGDLICARAVGAAQVVIEQTVPPCLAIGIPVQAIDIDGISTTVEITRAVHKQLSITIGAGAGIEVRHIQRGTVEMHQGDSIIVTCDQDGVVEIGSRVLDIASFAAAKVGNFRLLAAVATHHSEFNIGFNGAGVQVSGENANVFGILANMQPNIADGKPGCRQFGVELTRYGHDGKIDRLFFQSVYRSQGQIHRAQSVSIACQSNPAIVNKVRKRLHVFKSVDMLKGIRRFPEQHLAQCFVVVVNPEETDVHFTDIHYVDRQSNAQISGQIMAIAGKGG